MLNASGKSTLRILASPEDTDLGGQEVAPGRILEWIDKAGYACAVGWARSYCVTAYVGNVRFSSPVKPGQIVELNAQIIQTGRTSMQVLVSVWAADLDMKNAVHALDCILVFVAVDEERKPKPIEQWVPASANEQALYRSAIDRLESRKLIKEAMLAQTYTDEATTPISRFRFLASPGDTNWGGNAHGGIVMRWMFEAARTVAISWSGKTVDAIYSGGIHFLNPIKIGNIVEIDARIIHTDEFALHIATRVFTASAESPTDLKLTTVAMSKFVKLGDQGEVVALEQISLHSAEDFALDEHAKHLEVLRSQIPKLPDFVSQIPD